MTRAKWRVYKDPIFGGWVVQRPDGTVRSINYYWTSAIADACACIQTGEVWRA